MPHHCVSVLIMRSFIAMSFSITSNHLVPLYLRRNVYNNHWSGSIPNSIGALQDLQYLWVTCAWFILCQRFIMRSAVKSASVGSCLIDRGYLKDNWSCVREILTMIFLVLHCFVRHWLHLLFDTTCSSFMDLTCLLHLFPCCVCIWSTIQQNHACDIFILFLSTPLNPCLRVAFSQLYHRQFQHEWPFAFINRQPHRSHCSVSTAQLCPCFIHLYVLSYSHS